MTLGLPSVKSSNERNLGLRGCTAVLLGRHSGDLCSNASTRGRQRVRAILNCVALDAATFVERDLVRAEHRRTQDAAALLAIVAELPATQMNRSFV